MGGDSLGGRFFSWLISFCFKSVFLVLGEDGEVRKGVRKDLILLAGGLLGFR